MMALANGREIVNEGGMGSPQQLPKFDRLWGVESTSRQPVGNPLGVRVPEELLEEEPIPRLVVVILPRRGIVCLRVDLFEALERGIASPGAVFFLRGEHSEIVEIDGEAKEGVFSVGEPLAKI